MTSSPERIYLDNAATSWPKPEAVYQAVDRYQRSCGASSGRGVYSHAIESQQLVDQCRRSLATLLGASDPARVIFTSSGTDALNLAIQGILAPGDHVIASDADHNSVLRPLRMLEGRGLALSIIPLADGRIDLEKIERAVRPSTKLVCVNHASNVTGIVQPLSEIAAICQRTGALLLVDAAQSLGHLPIDVAALGCDLLASPGHKGLWGPLGTGLLYVGDRVSELLRPLRYGGTGSRSVEETMPTELPDRLEAGNLNLPGIAGLGAGVREVLQVGVAAIAKHEQQLRAELIAGLSSIAGVQLYGAHPGAAAVGVVSLNVEGIDPLELASLLDANFGMQVRAGLHCAPRMHLSLGTAPTGTVRLSLSHFTTSSQVASAVEAIRNIAEAMAG